MTAAERKLDRLCLILTRTIQATLLWQERFESLAVINGDAHDHDEVFMVT
jgi:hypothetical protein